MLENTLRPALLSIEGKDVNVYYMANPMMHEDWHKVESIGLVYAWYIHGEPDYWDDVLVFCKEEDKKLVEDYYNDNWWAS